MFDSRYEVFIADNLESRYIHHQLRYQVYCLESNYEDPSGFPTQLEMDSHDRNSVHFIVRSRSTGDWVGAMRLVLSPYESLPTKKVATIHKAAESMIKCGRVAEISRVCVLEKYRRKNQSDDDIKAVAPAPRPLGNTVNLDDRRSKPEIMLGLLRAAYHYSLTHKIDYWLFMAAPSLVRVLQRLAFNIRDVGPICDFRGKRVPYCCDMTTFTSNVEERSLAVSTMFARLPGYFSYASGAQHFLPDVQVVSNAI